MSVSQSPPLEELLAQVGWIRSLSRKLVDDPDLADEIVQQTLVRAANDGPREATSLRAWLAALLRNFARAGLRSQARRRIHERRAARPEGQPSVHEVVERAALQRELVESVMELDEPYRTTILLRFYEGQSPREIAAHTSTPVATVRTRLARGLALLRARLDRRHGGDRAAWVVLICPFRPLPLAPLAPLAAMNLKATLALCALCTAGAVWLFVFQGQPSPQLSKPLELETKRGEVELPRPADEAHGASQRSQAETLVAADVAKSQKSAAKIDESVRVRGRVVDVDSHPIRDLAIVLIANQTSTRTPISKSDVDGAFTIDRPASAGRLEVEDENWLTVFSGLVGSAADQRQCTIVVAPSAPLAGVVVDDQGLPLSGVSVEVRPQFQFRTRFADNLDACEDSVALEVSDAAGHFSFQRLPRCEGLRLKAELPAHVPYGAPLAATDRPFKTIALKRLSSGEDLVRGRVVDAGELPVAGAAIALGMDTTESDDRGEFAIPKAAAKKPRGRRASLELRALAIGRLPASFTPPVVDGEAQWPEFVTLHLGGKPLELAGRLERADGSPVAGARVWLVDSTTFGDGPQDTLQMEGWLAGDVEHAWHFATSASDGTFELGGLLPRDYEVCAVDAGTLERTTLAHVAAGRRDVVMQFPADACFERVVGVALDAHGVPLADVRVVPTAMGFMARIEDYNLFSTSMSVPGAVTDAQGNFSLDRVPRAGVSLEFSGEGVLMKRQDLDAAKFAAEKTVHLNVVLERCMHVQVELSDPTRADCYALVDAEGAQLTLTLRTGTITYFMERPPIVDGRSHVASATERARSVVLYKAGKEVGRAEVQLSSAGTTLIHM